MNSRLQSIGRLLRPLRSSLFDLVNQRGGSKADSTEAFDLQKTLGYIEVDFSQLASDAELVEFERFRLRPFVLQFDQILRREHATLGRPTLGWSRNARDPNLLAFCGSTATQRLVQQVCSPREMRIVEIAGGGATAKDRWESQCAARVGVFDLSSEDKMLRASVCQEVGISIALGQYPIVLARKGSRLPFDVDTRSVILEQSPSDLERIDVAIDEALLSVLPASGGSSFQTTLTRLCQQIRNPTPTERQLFHQLTSVSDSRVEALAITDLIMDARRHEGFALLYPRWAGDYPSGDSATCFHVTPFAEEFQQARSAVQKACGDMKVQYRKGDQGPVADILHSIWLLTCRADGVVADLTHLNDNVCIEIGMALALGRPVLLTARSGTEVLYPDIEKMQVRFYKTPPQLSNLVADFLTSLELES